MRTITTAIIASIALLGCGESTSDDGAIDTSIPSEPAFGGGKGDLPASCVTNDSEWTVDGAYDVTVEPDCTTRWASRGAKLESESQLRITATNAADLQRRLIGVCLRKLDYVRSPGVNEEHPVLAGWQGDESLSSTETPCGYFVIQPSGELTPAREGKPGIDTVLPPGWYDVGFGSPEGGETVELNVEVVPTGDVSCGDGELAPGEECDDGGNHPLDSCSASCEWNKMMLVQTRTAGDWAPDALDLEGFQDVQALHVFRDQEAADYMLFDSPEAGELTVEVTSSTNVSVQVFAAADLDNPAGQVDLEECGDSCKLPLSEGENYVAFIRQGSNSTYTVRLLGPSL